MAAPKGNKNGANGSKWRDALKRALGRYSSKVVKRGQALNTIAEKVVELALAGDKDAIAEIGNRLDGKPTQTIQGNGISLNFNILPYEDGDTPRLVLGERVVDTQEPAALPEKASD